MIIAAAHIASSHAPQSLGFGNNVVQPSAPTNDQKQEQKASVPQALNRPTVKSSGLLKTPTLLAAQEVRQKANDIKAETNKATDTSFKNAGQLSSEEKAQIKDLKARDQEVRAHERAHTTRGGQFAGQPKLSFVTGPDGRRYATAGEVPIDASSVKGDPEATIDKLRTVKAAALAPAQPSGQDKQVAAKAEAGIREAQGQLNAERAENLKGGEGEEQNTNAVAGVEEVDLTPIIGGLIG